ncbi:hypothetical protein PoB_003923300 [Plakobranchus ocellatus]|uniref:Uncharacterized protein n=1 Tax=Plakobranchus ocellatus TaxID=259542 RepID=A0AAV4AZI3_9GAST|nr:hypothetical protein PoB_003923300 [Plakobranchus ocellatus]
MLVGHKEGGNFFWSRTDTVRLISRTENRTMEKPFKGRFRWYGATPCGEFAVRVSVRRFHFHEYGIGTAFEIRNRTANSSLPAQSCFIHYIYLAKGLDHGLLEEN